MTKTNYPFKLGTTSYIIPDNVLPNVREISPLVDDIELVLFESPEISNIPSPDEIKELADLGAQYGCGYTVHLPIDKKAGAADENERVGFCDAASRIIERTLPLGPRAWILHLEGIKPDAATEEIDDWVQRCDHTILSLMEVVDSPAKVAIENLGYPWHWHHELAKLNRASLCCDVGHLWAYFDHNWQVQLEEMLPHTSVVHLHGFNGQKDHMSLASGDRDNITIFFEKLKKVNYNGVVTLEIFNQTDLSESVDMVRQIWEKLS